jgi:hypothetical protein
MSMGDALGAWLESVRAWLLSRWEFGWLHGWLADADVSAIWIGLVLIVVAMIVAIGFWPPLKQEKTPPADGETREL